MWLSSDLKAALSAMTVKTDRKDARGIAQLIRMGWFRPVHAKSMLFGAKKLDTGIDLRDIIETAGE
jgi:hypothetical protein